MYMRMPGCCGSMDVRMQMPCVCVCVCVRVRVRVCVCTCVCTCLFDGEEDRRLLLGGIVEGHLPRIRRGHEPELDTAAYEVASEVFGLQELWRQAPPRDSPIERLCLCESRELEEEAVDRVDGRDVAVAVAQLDKLSVEEVDVSRQAAEDSVVPAYACACMCMCIWRRRLRRTALYVYVYVCMCAEDGFAPG